MAVSGVLLVGTLVLPWGRGASNATLALVTVAGVFTGYVVHTELFHPENRIRMIVMLAASVFTLFTAFRVIESIRCGGIVLTGAAALAVAAAGWPAFGPKLLSGMGVPGDLLYVGSPAMWILLVLPVAGVALVLYLLSRLGVRPLRSGGLALVAVASFLVMLILVLRFELGEARSATTAMDGKTIRTCGL